MEPMKGLVCGLSAFRFKPQIPQIPQHNQQHAYEGEQNDVEEITEHEFRRNCGYSAPRKRSRQEQGHSFN
ncbi:unnamed protein product [Cochlearia groenlandica]